MPTVLSLLSILAHATKVKACLKRLLYDNNTTNKLHHYLNAACVRFGRIKKWVLLMISFFETGILIYNMDRAIDLIIYRTAPLTDAATIQEL